MSTGLAEVELLTAYKIKKIFRKRKLRNFGFAYTRTIIILGITCFVQMDDVPSKVRQNSMSRLFGVTVCFCSSKRNNLLDTL